MEILFARMLPLLVPFEQNTVVGDGISVLIVTDYCPKIEMLAGGHLSLVGAQRLWLRQLPQITLGARKLDA